MEDIFKTIGNDVKIGAEDVAHIVKESVEFPVIGIAVIKTCVSDYSNLKPILGTLVTDGAQVGALVIAAVAEKGLSWTDDVAAAHSAATFFSYFMQTFVPQVEAIYKQLNADTTVASATPTTSATN